MLREWREDRRRSQMDLAIDVGVSTRHLSFVETGKSKPSPELVLALAEHLDVPLRERSAMLLAAVPLQLRVGDYTQSWFSTNTSIGTPVDITLDELHVELFHPADEATAAMVGGRTA